MQTKPFQTMHPKLFRRFHLPLTVLASLAATLAAQAIPTIDLPDLALQANQANQTFTIQIENTGSPINLTGVQLELITGNGDVRVGGSGGAPAITGVSVISSGLLFAGNNTGDRGAGNFSGTYVPPLQQVYQRLTSTSSGAVFLGSGTFDLATVTFDTTGITSGVYSWSAAASPNGKSFLTDTNPSPMVSPRLADGTLTVQATPVPNTTSTAIVLLLSMVMLAWCQFHLARRSI